MSLEIAISEVISKAPCMVNQDIYYNDDCKHKFMKCPYQVSINNNYQCDLVNAVKTTVFNYTKEHGKNTP